MGETIRSRGMRDILPGDMERFRRIEEAFRQVCLGWGYEEIRTPTIEHLFLFTSAGTLSPRMLDRVYSFLDWDGWSGERVVLRPDSTIPAVRLFEEAMADRDSARLFYVQNVFRFEQGDASREDWQCGVELLGDSFPRGDIELVLMAGEVVALLGLDAVLSVSHPGIVRAVLDAAQLDPAEQAEAYARILAGDNASLDDLGGRLELTAPLGRLLSLEGEGPEYIENLRALLAGAVPGIAVPLDELKAVSTVLAEIEVKHSVAPLGARDFEYYTGPVFALNVAGDRVGGGGRYDSLAGLIGKRPTPASGFALEMDKLALAVAPSEADVSSVAITRDESGTIEALLRLATALRRNGIAIDSGNAGRIDRKVAVSAQGYSLQWNGAPPCSFTDPDLVASAIADALSVSAR
jgi:histidyl-tRNA synthetase